MPRRLSNSDRIAKAAAEAKAEADEKATKKATKKTAKKTKKKTAKKATKRTRKAAGPPPRMKIVWAVGAPGATPAKTFHYRDRGMADAEAAKIGKGAIVKALRVPMEDPAASEEE